MRIFVHLQRRHFHHHRFSDFCLNAVLMDFVAKYVKLPKHKMGVELIDYTIK